MNKLTVVLLAAFLIPVLLFAQTKKDANPLYKNKHADTNLRIKDLLSRMTIEEKAGQLNQLNSGVLTGPAASTTDQQQKIAMIKKGMVGSLLNAVGADETRAIQKIAVEQSRLGIPLLFAFDVIHGYKTLFPIPLAEACSWDMNQIIENSRIAATEAASSGLHWTFAPMCDISTDPRWGRVMEGAGEDPYYGSQVAAARVKGFQGNLDQVNNIMACVKHFAVYGAVEAGREYNFVDVSRVQLWNKYLPPYYAAVKAGAATVMNSFNVIDGIPASGNKYLITDVLKNKWGFKGFLVSDWNSFGEMIPHGYAADKKDATLKAFLAGSMMDMESRVTVAYLPLLVKEGKISLKQVDDAVGRILYYKFKLGLFDDPYRYSDTTRETHNVFSKENRQVARKAAAKSIVLLKNDNHILPLKAGVQKVALVGYYAASKKDMVDMWHGNSNYQDYVSIYEGLQNKFGKIAYADGYKPDNSTNDTLISEAVRIAKSSDVIIVNIGISGTISGENKSLADINVPEGQLRLLRELKKVGKPVVVLVSAGRPLVLTSVPDLSDALVQCWLLGTETGNAVADILSGTVNPSAKTVMSFPYSVGQIPVYYNHFNSGRPEPEVGNDGFYSRFLDIPNMPLYPFGYGLSYTNYDYRDLKLSAKSITSTQNLKASITVKNSGKLDGEEVVQLYIHDVSASIIRPVKELKGFQKVTLKAGEEKTITFTLSPKDLSFYDQQGNTRLEKGAFEVFIGGNSRDVLKSGFELK